MSEIVVPDYGCVTNTKVYGLYESFRRAKFPMSVDVDKLTEELTKGIRALAQSPKGEGHDNWLCGVIVQFDLTFSNKAWVEMERYHFCDIISSQSTMHRMTRFSLDEAFDEHTDPRVVEIMREKIAEYNALLADPEANHELLEERYLEILHTNPAGFMLTAGMSTNYRQLKTIYAQRRHHRLPIWREFCAWIETLPYAELITGEQEVKH